MTPSLGPPSERRDTARRRRGMSIQEGTISVTTTQRANDGQRSEGPGVRERGWGWPAPWPLTPPPSPGCEDPSASAFLGATRHGPHVPPVGSCPQRPGNACPTRRVVEAVPPVGSKVPGAMPWSGRTWRTGLSRAPRGVRPPGPEREPRRLRPHPRTFHEVSRAVVMVRSLPAAVLHRSTAEVAAADVQAACAVLRRHLRARQSPTDLSPSRWLPRRSQHPDRRCRSATSSPSDRPAQLHRRDSGDCARRSRGSGAGRSRPKRQCHFALLPAALPNSPRGVCLRA